MKQLLLLAFVFLTIQPVFSQNENENTTSTYYFIRHAEKDRSDLQAKINRFGRAKKVGFESRI